MNVSHLRLRFASEDIWAVLLLDWRFSAISKTEKSEVEGEETGEGDGADNAYQQEFWRRLLQP